MVVLGGVSKLRIQKPEGQKGTGSVFHPYSADHFAMADSGSALSVLMRIDISKRLVQTFEQFLILILRKIRLRPG